MEVINLEDLNYVNMMRLNIQETYESNLFLYKNIVYKIFKRNNVKNLDNKEKKVEILHKLLNGSTIYPLQKLYYNGFFIGYTMPYVIGNTLDSYAFNSPKTLLPLLHDFKREIEGFHHLNICLGDIHPKNIIVDEKGITHACDLDNCSVLGYPHDCLRNFQQDYLLFHDIDLYLDYFAFNIVCISLLSNTIEPFVIDQMRKNRLFFKNLESDAFYQMLNLEIPTGSPYILDHMKETSIKKRVLSLFR